MLISCLFNFLFFVTRSQFCNPGYPGAAMKHKLITNSQQSSNSPFLNADLLVEATTPDSVCLFLFDFFVSLFCYVCLFLRYRLKLTDQAVPGPRVTPACWVLGLECTSEPVVLFRFKAFLTEPVKSLLQSLTDLKPELPGSGTLHIDQSFRGMSEDSSQDLLFRFGFVFCFF